jgi:teichuronic acid biosynthesis glycosyltransferase TuaG
MGFEREGRIMDVSVIMTVYNGEDYLEESIQSVLNQREIEVELIVVDDGSTDETAAILKKYQRYDNVTIISSEKIGRGNALNLAISKTATDFIANLDADDLFHPEKLRIQYEIMQEDEYIAVLGTGGELISEDFNLRDIEKSRGGEMDIRPIKVPRSSFGKYNPVGHITVMIRKDVLEEVGGYNAKRKGQFDYDLWIRILEKNHSIYNLPAPLVYKRIHRNQSFERKNRLRYLRSSTALQREAIRELDLSKKYYLYSALRLFYGLLPIALRRKDLLTRLIR